MLTFQGRCICGPVTTYFIRRIGTTRWQRCERDAWWRAVESGNYETKVKT